MVLDQAGGGRCAVRSGGYRSTVTFESSADELRGIEFRRLAAIVSGDQVTLETLHAPDFLLCTPSGTVWTRRHYVDGLVDGSIRFTRFQPVTPLEVALDSRLAVIRYRSAIEISVDHAEAGALECWHLDVYERSDQGQWRCRWSQATDTILDQPSSDAG